LRTAILIPVKQLSAAKQRLALCLSATERAELAAAMMADVFAAASQVSSTAGIFVVTSDEFASALAGRCGWQVLHEEQQTSESDSVDRASLELVARGFAAALRLPADIPLVQPADIEELIAAAPDKPGCVIVPSRDGTGTNALLRTPPHLFASHFGPGSFRLHLAAAAQRGAEIRVIRNPRLELDVDDEADFHTLLAAGLAAGQTQAWFEQRGVARHSSR